jgi:hypothetical protein
MTVKQKPATKKPANKPVAKKPVAKKPATKKPVAKQPVAKASSDDVSALIDMQLEDLGDWRGELLGKLRAVIRAAAPDAIEELKWGGVPVWSDAGIITTGETYKTVVKLTFAKGASLPDPKKLFNSSLGGNTRRAIDFPQGATIDVAGLTALVRAAVALNRGR